MLTRARAAVVVLAALSLGACSNVHPGSAAVVDGESISMRTLGKTAEAYCKLTADAAKQQGVTSVSNSQVRRQAIVGLVSVVVARDLAKAEGLTISPASYQLTAAQRDQLAKAFPDDDIDELSQAVEDSREVSAIAVALAAKRTGQPATEANEAQLADAGQAEIMKAFASKGVKFAPRFGLDPSANVRAETGSISVTPVDLEAPTAADLPAALRCS